MLKLEHNLIKSEIKITDESDKLWFHRNGIKEIIARDGYYSVIEHIGDNKNAESVETMRVPIANTVMTIVK